MGDVTAANAATTASEQTQMASAFDPQAATEAYLATVNGEARVKSDTYFEGGYRLDAFDAGMGVLIATLLLFLGLSRRIRDMAVGITSIVSLQTLIYALVYIGLIAALMFPMEHYRGFTREHEFGLSNLTFSDWLSEYLINFAVDLVLGSVFVVVVYKVIRAAGSAAWLWATAVTITFLALMIMISPVFISPLLNKYEPMAEGKLKTELLSMARANGIPADNIYQFDASKQSKRISANVSGLFGTTRISLNDNLLNRSTPESVKAVMGHEMGHYVLNHAYKFLLTLSVVFAIIFALSQSMFTGLVARFGAWWGVRDLGDIAGLPLLAGIIGFLSYLATPAFNTMIRVSEAEADIFGLNAAREPDGFAQAAMQLSEYRKLDPGYWEHIIFYDHPSGRARVEMSMKWKAENMLTPVPTPLPTPPVVEPVATKAP